MHTFRSEDQASRQIGGNRIQAAAISIICVIMLLLSACSPAIGENGSTTPTARGSRTPISGNQQNQTGSSPTPTQIDLCPAGLSSRSNSDCLTPHSLRVAYGIESLIEHGFTGKGQTVVDIVSFGSPTLQQDMDVFDQQFDLPPITVKVISPLGTTPQPGSKPGDIGGWADETNLDVQIIHAMAPDAGIVVLTSPVDETEGTIGLPQFRQLVQYALDHHLGNILSFSWGASEVTLQDAAGQQEIQKWNTLLQNATTQQGITFFSSSGDNGATDYEDLQETQLSPTPTTSFPADEPWVTSVGGTTLLLNGASITERAWSDSGGGFSKFFPIPSFQQPLCNTGAIHCAPTGLRGVPDVAADANPATAMAVYSSDQWQQIGGTSASAPLWAGLMAIANQMAGHPLGFINPALYKLAMSSSYALDFRDITVGNNSVNGHVRVVGYNAGKGWDPITGLGAPIGEKLLPDLIAAMKR